MNITNDLALNFCNELFDYFENNSKMMWTEDDFVRFRLRELYKIKKMDEVKALLFESIENPGGQNLLPMYINLGIEFLKINDEEMAFYDEELNSTDYFYFCFLDDLCDKYVNLIQLNSEVQTS